MQRPLTLLVLTCFAGILYASVQAETQRRIVHTDASSADQNWEPGFILPLGLDGQVNAFAVLGSDLYVGGQFEKAGDLVVNGLARWDGSSWHSVGNGVHGSVNALAASDGRLYVGGQFDRAGDTATTNLACWNGSEWQSIGSVTGADEYWLGSPRVIGLHATPAHLWVVGYFRSAGGVSATNIAGWDGTNWFGLGSGLGSRGGQVHAVAQIGSRLYAGGMFFNAGEVFATNIACWNGKRWGALGKGLTGGRASIMEGHPQSGSVECIAVRNGSVFVGGSFTRAGNVHVQNLARWRGSRWERVGRGITADGQVNGVTGLTFHKRDLLVSGTFTSANAVPATNIAVWNGLRWKSLGAGVNGTAGPIAIVGDQLYVGGDFGVAGDTSAANIARWNGAEWTSLGQGLPGNTVMGIPTTIAASANQVFVAGYLHTAGTRRINNVAVWDGAGWSTLGNGLPGASVQASAVSGSNYYVAGGFILPEIGATNIACWNGTEWSALGGGVRYGDSPGHVRSMTAAGSRVFVSGYFTSAGGVPATNIAVWNGTNWSAVGDLRYNQCEPSITALAAGNEHVFASGMFGNTGYEDSVARWDGNNWQSIWHREFGQPSSFVGSLWFAQNHLYAFGYFVQAADIATTNFARWDGTHWSAMGHPFSLNTEIATVAATATSLYVGGNLTNAAGSAVSSIARYDGTNWYALGSGLIAYDGRGYARGLATQGNRLYAIGDFKTAGGKPSHGFAAWTEPTPIAPTTRYSPPGRF